MSCAITIKDDGPILVTGEFQLQDASGKAFGLAGRATIGLCRCGASANKPFCDGSHRSAAFNSQVQACELPPPKK